MGHRQPALIAEITLIVDDPELTPIRMMLTRNDRERSAYAQAVDSLVGNVAAAVSLLQQLPESPSISIYVWDEFHTTRRDPSTEVAEKLIRQYGKSEHVRVLTQFPRKADGNLSAQTIAVRHQWQKKICATTARSRRLARARTFRLDGRRWSSA